MTFEVGNKVRRVSNFNGMDELKPDEMYTVTAVNEDAGYPGEIEIEGGEAWPGLQYSPKYFEYAAEKLGDPSAQEDAVIIDYVNNPPHYIFEDGVEVIDLTEQLNFNSGNAVKYVARAGRKDPAKAIEDLEKAEFYVKKELARVKRRSGL